MLPDICADRLCSGGGDDDRSSNRRDIACPRPIPLVVLGQLLFGYEEHLRRKYCLPGFVEVKAEDIVIDGGAYVGGFSLSPALIAREMHALYPDATTLTPPKRLENSRLSRNGIGQHCRAEVGPTAAGKEVRIREQASFRMIGGETRQVPEPDVRQETSIFSTQHSPRSVGNFSMAALTKQPGVRREVPKRIPAMIH